MAEQQEAVKRQHAVAAALASVRPMSIGGATLAGVAMRAGLIDEYVLATYPVLVGGGTPYFTALDNWADLNLVETRTFPGRVVLTRYETRR